MFHLKSLFPVSGRAFNGLRCSPGGETYVLANPPYPTDLRNPPLKKGDLKPEGEPKTDMPSTYTRPILFTTDVVVKLRFGEAAGAGEGVRSASWGEGDA